MGSTTALGAGYILAPDQNVVVINPDVPAAVFAATDTFTILGMLQIASANPGFLEGVAVGVTAASAANVFKVGAGGSFSLVGADTAVGYSGEAAFINDGTFTVTGGNAATGISFVDFQGQLNPTSFDNTGTFTIDSDGFSAVGVGNARGRIANSGTFTVNGNGAITWGILVTGPDHVIANTGAITATGANSAAIQVINGPGPWSAAPIQITNSGSISAALAAIGAPNNGLPTDGSPLIHLDNSGSITGGIALGGGAPVSAGIADGSVIRNTGSIHGGIALAINGDDTYDGRGGTLSGPVTLGGGTDHIFLGDDGETVEAGYVLTMWGQAGTAIVLGGAGADHITGNAGDDVIDGGAGDDVLDGGRGINTLSYASASAGVTVDLNQQGAAQDTVGAGRDTLSHFQNLIGSAFADLLSGDAGANVMAGGKGADTLTGAGGADTFVFTPGSGADVVTDFSRAQGDRIDLTAYRTLHGLADVQPLLSQAGPDAVLHLLGGGQVTLDAVTASTLIASDFLLAPRLPGDFDGDGTGDILWQNTANSLVSAWTMNDLQAAGISLPAAQGWKAMDVGDFDANGYSGDILFRNPVTGKVVIWTDNAGTMSGQDVDRATLDWNIMGTADFNGDGKSDILWRNEQNGYVSVWQMDGAHVTTTYNPGQVGLEWKIVGAGDYVGDGKAEVLWRNTATGEVNLWTIDGPGAGQTHGVKIADLGAEWQVAGSGDFNGDGRTDILWRDSTTAQVVIWEMNGAQVQAFGTVATLGGQWAVAGVQDINSDGKADILWRDTGTGQAVAWVMDGTHVDHAGPIAVADPAWQIINHHFDWA